MGKFDSDGLGNRIKSYESLTNYQLMHRGYVILRLDGAHFSRYTKGLNKPFDKYLMRDMIDTTKYLCENIQGCKLGYTQSDEISLVLTDFETYETQAWFDNQVQKMCSISASLATSKFNQLRAVTAYWEGKQLQDILKLKLAEFDARVFQVPTRSEAYNTILWRQQDAIKNSISGCAQVLYSHKELDGRSSKERQELIFKKGEELKQIFIKNGFKDEIDVNKFNFNWNDIPANLKRGISFYKKPTIKYFSKDIWEKDKNKEDWEWSATDKDGNTQPDGYHYKTVSTWTEDALDYNKIDMQDSVWSTLIPDNK